MTSTLVSVSKPSLYSSYAMAIKIYGSRQSSCTQRVIMMLFELGLDYELSDVNLQLGEHKVALKPVQ